MFLKETLRPLGLNKGKNDSRGGPLENPPGGGVVVVNTLASGIRN